MPGWVAAVVPPLGPKFIPLVPAQWVGQAKQIVTDLNTTILFGLPISDRLQVMGAPALRTVDLQDTGIGGAPHPNASGHDLLAQTLATAFNNID